MEKECIFKKGLRYLPESLAGLTGKDLFLKPVSKDWGSGSFFKCEGTSNAKFQKIKEA